MSDFIEELIASIELPNRCQECNKIIDNNAFECDNCKNLERGICQFCGEICRIKDNNNDSCFRCSKLVFNRCSYCGDFYRLYDYRHDSGKCPECNLFHSEF